jgi:hypothetical protein
MWLKLGLLFINIPSLLAAFSSFVRREGRINRKFTKLHFSSVANPDPGSGIQCFFDLRIRDPFQGSRMEKNPDPGSWINIPNHISESFETILGKKILKFFVDPLPF